MAQQRTSALTVTLRFPPSSLSDLENTTLTNGAGTILIFREGVLMVQNTLFSAKNA
jgi:hypothetical protein